MKSLRGMLAAISALGDPNDWCQQKRCLRFSTSTKYINKYLYDCLVSTEILRPFRGCRSGRKVKERNAYCTRICTIKTLV